MAVKLSQKELNKIAAGDFGHYVEGLKPIDAAIKADPVEKAKKEEKKPVGRPKEMHCGKIISCQLGDVQQGAIVVVKNKLGITKSEAIRVLISMGFNAFMEKSDQPDPVDQTAKEPIKEEPKTQAPQAVRPIPQPSISTVGRHF